MNWGDVIEAGARALHESSCQADSRPRCAGPSIVDRENARDAIDAAADLMRDAIHLEADRRMESAKAHLALSRSHRAAGRQQRADSHMRTARTFRSEASGLRDAAYLISEESAL